MSSLDQFPKSAPSLFLPVPISPTLIQQLDLPESNDSREFGAQLASRLKEEPLTDSKYAKANEASAYQSATLTPLWANQSASFLADLHLKSSLTYSVDKKVAEQTYTEVKNNDTSKAADRVAAILSEKEAERRKKIQDLITLHNVEYMPDIDNKNPFKEGTPEYEAFNTLDVFKGLREGTTTSLEVLGDEGKRIIEDALKMAGSRLKSEEVEDPFQDTKIKTFNVSQNYFDLFSNEDKWKNWDKKTTFGVLLARWSQLSTSYKTVRSFSGPSYDYLESVKAGKTADSALASDSAFKTYVDTMKKTLGEMSKLVQNLISGAASDEGDLLGLNPSSLKSAPSTSALKSGTGTAAKVDKTLTELSEQVLAFKARAKDNPLLQDQVSQLEALVGTYDEAVSAEYQLNKKIDSVKDHALKYAKNWMDVVGKNLQNQYMIVGFATFLKSAPDALTQTNLANWDGQSTSDLAAYLSASKDGLMDKFISDGLAYIKSTFIEKEFSIPALKEGAMSKSKLNFEANDLQKSGGLERKNIKINTAYGQSMTMEELLSLVGKGSTVSDRYNNAIQVKNTVMDMIEQLSGIGYKKSGTAFKVTGRRLEDAEIPEGYTGDKSKLIAVKLHSNVDWEQFSGEDKRAANANTQASTGSLTQQTGKPFEMMFESTEKAQAYLDMLMKLDQTLDAVLQPFDRGGHKTMTEKGPVETDYRLLVTNEGELGKSGLITKDSAEYSVSVDTFLKGSDIKNYRWDAISTYIEFEGAMGIARTALGGVTVNIQRSSDKKAEIEKYDEEKEEFKQEQIREQKEKNEKEVQEKRRVSESEKASKEQAQIAKKNAEKVAQERKAIEEQTLAIQKQKKQEESNKKSKKQ